jgi:hypothetical protein
MSKRARIVQIVLLVVIVFAGIRLYLSMRERRDTFVAPQQKQVALDADAYVMPKKLHPQDLQDAKELTRQPAWVRAGYQIFFYPFNGRTDFKREAGRLGPIEKLDIKDVVVDRPPDGEKQVMAVFEKDGKRYAFTIGNAEDNSYKIYSDDILFIQDPHELYKHWPADLWQAIDNHQVKPGMNELQASFAVGVGTPEGTGASNPRIVNYQNDGHPLRVTFANGKATEIVPGSPASSS